MKTLTTILTALAFGATVSFAADEKPAATEPVKDGTAVAKPAATEPAKPGADKPKRDPEVAFKRIDKDSDGAVSLEEFKASPMGKRDETKAAETFKRRDKDSDGKLTLEEFKAPNQRKER